MFIQKSIQEHLKIQKFEHFLFYSYQIIRIIAFTDRRQKKHLFLNGSKKQNMHTTRRKNLHWIFLGRLRRRFDYIGSSVVVLRLICMAERLKPSTFMLSSWSLLIIRDETFSKTSYQSEDDGASTKASIHFIFGDLDKE